MKKRNRFVTAVANYFLGRGRVSASSPAPPTTHDLDAMQAARDKRIRKAARGPGFAKPKQS